MLRIVTFMVGLLSMENIYQDMSLVHSILGATVPADIEDVGVMGKWLNQLLISYLCLLSVIFSFFLFFSSFITLFIAYHNFCSDTLDIIPNLTGGVTQNLTDLDQIYSVYLKGPNPNFVESACVGLTVQVYTDLTESRNLPSMPVIKDVTINGGFSRECTPPLLPQPSKQPSPQKGNAINVTTLTCGFTQDNNIDFKTPL